jgi:beta-mannosidase
MNVCSFNELSVFLTVYTHSKASEFGASVMSSFESMSGTISSESWGLHGGFPPDTCENVIGAKNKCQGNNTMAERNYPCETHIVAYFGNHTSLDGVGEPAFQMQLYQCMMAQSLWMKGEIEKRRSKNSFGLLVSMSLRLFFSDCVNATSSHPDILLECFFQIWQLNENWPTGGWGAIEYGTQAHGQVTGGRWKPLVSLYNMWIRILTL